nr:hypothetical protein BaRGS_032670 [Batillaria attramentaria]
MRPPEDTLARRDKALSRVLDAFEYLGRELERSGVEGLFMVSGVSYENYLNRLPKKVTQNFEVPRPQDVATRGELDILILHPNAGILLVQVKSVGENLAAWKASDEDAAKAIKKVLIKAAGMTGRDEAVFKHILQDLDPVPTFTKVVALPFVSRSEFEKAMTQKDDLTSTCRLFLTDMKIVCKDEIEDTVELCNSESMVKHIPIPKQIEYSSHESGMLRWWHQTFLRNGSRLNLDHLKTIVGRVCGLLSSLHVQPDSKSRVEVKTYGQAVSETAERTTAFNLTPTLHRVLGIQDPYVAIVGPPATGKTMLLGMKGRRWREEGRHVVVVNFGPEEAGLPNAHALLEVINSGLKDDVFPKASRMDLALCHIKEDDLTQKINNFIQQFQQSSQHDDPTSVECDKKVCFIVDDLLLLRRMPRVLKFLRDHPISDSVWCSTSGFSEDKRKELMGYKIIVLDNVVRCPITVQALLLKLEKREDWKAAYAKCSVDAGLPTKGPPLVFLHHQQHLLQKQTDASKDLRPGAEDGSDSDENTPAGRVVDGTLDRTGTPHGKELADGTMVQEVTAQNPLQCLECGHDVASFIGTLLKESEKPEHPPLVQSKKPSSEGSKSRSPGVLHYRDVVIVYPLPRKIMPNGIIRMCVSPDELDAHWKSVEASPFVLGVREKGIPVKVVRSQEAREIALQSSEQSVILTDAFIVRSLERKVVIFVPLTQSKSAAEHNDLPNAQENSPV